MKFNTFDELSLWLKCYENCKFNDSTSQGECYKIGNKVYKIFIQFLDEEYCDFIEYDNDSILQFSSIKNKTYIWPIDTIMVGDIVVGYITNYVDAKSLYKINPLLVNLDKFEKALESVIPDIKVISDNGVLTFDVAYNILYGRYGFKVIDHMEYSRTDMDSIELYRINKDRFNYEIRLFLIDGYFDEFINDNSLLYSMCYDHKVDVVDFLREFRRELSEKEGHEILRLGEAKKSMTIHKSRNPKYIRSLCR